MGKLYLHYVFETVTIVTWNNIKYTENLAPLIRIPLPCVVVRIFVKWKDSRNTATTKTHDTSQETLEISVDIVHPLVDLFF